MDRLSENKSPPRFTVSIRIRKLPKMKPIYIHFRGQKVHIPFEGFQAIILAEKTSYLDRYKAWLTIVFMGTNVNEVLVTAEEKIKIATNHFLNDTGSPYECEKVYENFGKLFLIFVFRKYAT